MKTTVKSICYLLLSVTLGFASCDKNGDPETPVDPGDERCNTQISEWLYGTEYEDYDFDALCEIMDYMFYPEAGCSQVRKGNFVGRNLDWYITDEATCIVKVDAKNNKAASGLQHISDARYASIATNAVTDMFTRDIAQSGVFDDVYLILPAFIAEGINEKGLYTGLNVAPTGETSLDPDKWRPLEWGLGAAFTNPGAEHTLNVGLLNRVLLDHASSVDEALQIINSINWYEPYNFPAEGMSQSFQWLIADSTKTCVLEFIENKPVALVSDNITEASLSTIMTNFCNVLFQHGIINHFGSGYERYEEATATYDTTPATMDGLKDMMQLLWYTKGYTRKQNTPGFRYSDVIPDDIGYDDFFAHPEWKTQNQYIIDYISEQQDMFNNRKGWHTEDCPLWYSRHTAVYDIRSRSYKIFLHEGLDVPRIWYDVTMDVSFAKPLDVN